MSLPLRIHLLGPFEVFRDGQPLTNSDWHSQQTRQIAKILLARPGQVIPSDQLIDMIWPEDEPEAARRRLHVRISQLRQALGGGKTRVQTVDGGYLFNLTDDCWLDSVAFQTARDEGHRYLEGGQQPEAIQAYEDARDLYRGDLLAEDLYLDWTFLPREFFREQYLTLLTELAEAYAQQGRYRLAMARCQEALECDHLRETIYVRLMLYHYYAGERPQALRIFERCRTVLADELGVTPLETSITLAEQIQAGTLWAATEAPRYPPPIYAGRLFEVPYTLSETPLIGREREYAWLVDHWNAASTRVLLLAGGAGIGKTRLVTEFIGFVTAAGGTILSARIPLGEHTPFTAVLNALRPLLQPETMTHLPPAILTTLAEFWPEVGNRFPALPKLPQLSAEGARQRGYVALEALLMASDPHSSVLVVDDAHRLGLAACELLARLSNTIKILLSYRSEEIPAGHPLPQVFQVAGSKNRPARLQLEPLPQQAVAALVAALARNNLGSLSPEIAAQTEGNPLYVVTLLQHLFDEGLLYIGADGAWGIASEVELSLPPTMQATIETRLQRLTRAQRHVFDLIAVLGGEFDFALLQAASQQTEEELLTIIDALIEAALLIEPRRTGRPEFSSAHDRYIEAAYATLPKVRKKQFHHRAAKALEQVYAASLSDYYPALADHFGTAKLIAKERHYAALAGEQAATQFANTTALKYLNRALVLTPREDNQTRVNLLLTREAVHDLLGDRQSQETDLNDLTALAGQLEPDQQAEIHQRQGAYHWVLGEFEPARTHLEQAISQAQSCGAATIEANSLLLLARCVTPEYDQSHEYLQAALTIAETHQLRVQQGDIIRNLGNIHYWQNNFEQAKDYFKQALAIHREVGDLRGELSALNNLGYLSQNLGEPHQARNFFEQGLAICTKIGDRLAEGVLLANLGGLVGELGEYAQSEIYLREACEIREAVKNEEGVGVLLPALGSALQKQGKYTETKNQLERALEINTRIQHPLQICLSLDALAQFYCELGAYETALEHFEHAVKAFTDDERSPHRVRALANGSLLQHLMGNHTAAWGIGQQALTLSMDLPLIRATALTNLGHAYASLQNFEVAAENYQQALALRTELQQPHLGLEIQAGLAQLALGVGADQQALAHIEAILPHLETPLMGPDQPMWVYLTCYRVLVANDDARAMDVLWAAYTALQARAATIKDAALQKSYLGNVAVNQKILKLAEKFDIQP